MQMATSIGGDNGEMIVKRVSVPLGLEELMEGLTKEVILKKPKDICVFASEYFANLLNLREKGSLKVPSGKRIQSITKQISADAVVKQLKVKSNSVGPTKTLSRQRSVQSDSPIKKPLTTKKIVLNSKEDKNEKTDKTKSFLDKRRARKDSKDDGYKKKTTPSYSDQREKKISRLNERSTSRSTDDSVKTPRGRIETKQQKNSGRINNKTSPRKDDKVVHTSNKKTHISNEVVETASAVKVVDLENNEATDIVDTTLNNKDDVENKNKVVEMLHDNESNGSANKLVVGCTMKDDIAEDITTENVSNNIRDTPKDVEKITVDQNENKSNIASNKEEQHDVNTDYSIDEVDKNTSSTEKQNENVCNNNGLTEKSLTDSNISNINHNDNDVKPDEIKNNLDSLDKEAEKIHPENTSIEQSSSDLLHLAENDKIKKSENEKISTETEKQSLVSVPVKENDNMQHESENINFDDAIKMKDINKTTNENANDDLLPNDVQNHNAKTNMSLDNKQFEEILQKDHENKENINVNNKEISDNTSEETGKKIDDPKETVPIKHMRKSLSEEHLKNQDKDNKKTRRIKSVDSNKNNLKNLKSPTKIPLVSNEDEKQDKVEEKSRTKRSLTGDVEDNINVKETHNFDTSKLREEINAVSELSKTTNFKTNYNPYKLRQEIKQASQDSKNNNSIPKIANELAAVLKIQSIWRGYACRKNIEKMKQIPKDTTNNKSEEAHVNLTTNHLTEANVDDVVTTNKERKNNDISINLVEKSEDPIKDEKKTYADEKKEANKEQQNDVTAEQSVNNVLMDNKRSCETTSLEQKYEGQNMLNKDNAEKKMSSINDDNKETGDETVSNNQNSIQQNHTPVKEESNLLENKHEQSLSVNDVQPIERETKEPTQEMEVTENKDIGNEKLLDKSEANSTPKEDKNNEEVIETKEHKTLTEYDDKNNRVKEDKSKNEKFVSSDNAGIGENNTITDMKQDTQNDTINNKDTYLNCENKVKSQILSNEESNSDIQIEKTDEKQKIDESERENVSNIDTKDKSTEKGEKKAEDKSINSQGEYEEKTLKEKENEIGIAETVTKNVNSPLSSASVGESNINEEQSPNTTEQNDTIVYKNVTLESKNANQNIDITETKSSTKQPEILSMADAVTRIQARWRGFKVRKQLEHEQLFGASVMKEIKHKEDLEVSKKVDKHAAVSKIQAVWRGYKVRKNIKDVNHRLAELQKPSECDEMPSQRELSDEDIFKAATKIQAGVRGYMVRKKNSICKLKSITEETTPVDNMADDEIISSLEQLQDVPPHSPELHKNTDYGNKDVETCENMHSVKDTTEKMVSENLHKINNFTASATKDESDDKQMMSPVTQENVDNLLPLAKQPNDDVEKVEKHETIKTVSAETHLAENPNKVELHTSNDKSNEKQIITESNTENVDNQMTGNEEAKNNEMVNTKEDNKKTDSEVKFIGAKLNSSTTNKLCNSDTTALIDDTISNSNVNKDEVDPVYSIIHDEPGYEDAPTRPVTSNTLQESANKQNIDGVAEERAENKISHNTDSKNKSEVQNKNSENKIDKFSEGDTDKKNNENFFKSQESTTSVDSCSTVIFNDTQAARLSHDDSQTKLSTDDNKDNAEKDKQNSGQEDLMAEPAKIVKLPEELDNENVASTQKENVSDSIPRSNTAHHAVEPPNEKKIIKENETYIETAPNLHKTDDESVSEGNIEEKQKHALTEIKKTINDEVNNLTEINNNMESSQELEENKIIKELNNDNRSENSSGHHDESNSKESANETDKERNEFMENKKLENSQKESTDSEVFNSDKTADINLSDAKTPNGTNHSVHETNKSEPKTDDVTSSSNDTLSNTPVSQSSMENNKLNLSALENEIINANKHKQGMIAKHSEKHDHKDKEDKDTNADISSSDDSKTDNSLSMTSISENDKVKNEITITDTSPEKQREEETITMADKDILRIHIPLRELSEIKEEDGDMKSSTESVEELEDESKSSRSHVKTLKDDEIISQGDIKAPDTVSTDTNATQKTELASQAHDDVNRNKVESENVAAQSRETHETPVNNQEEIRKKSASPVISLVHSGEFHDRITVPIPVSPPVTSSKEGENLTNPRQSSPQTLVNTGELHDSVLPLSVQLNEAPPAGAEILTSQASDSITIDGQKGAQASDKDASACETQPDITTSSAASMETEKRNNATTIPKKNMEAEAATKIQAGFRGYQVRKQLKGKISAPGDISNQRRSARRKSSGRLTESGRIIHNKSKTPSDIEEKSAVKIQAGVRGFLVRRRQKKQKQGKESS